LIVRNMEIPLSLRCFAMVVSGFTLLCEIGAAGCRRICGNFRDFFSSLAQKTGARSGGKPLRTYCRRRREAAVARDAPKLRRY
jgi:hypothetical protein